MDFSGKNLIGAEWSGKGSTFHAENPSTRERLKPDFFEATPEEISDAIEKAHRAFPIYRAKSGKQKAEFLEAIAEQILALGDTLIRRCAEETGLPESRLMGETGRTVGQLRLFAQLLREGSWLDARIDTADPERVPLPKPDVRSMMRPIGPVGIFGASNFPLAFSVAGGDTASALAAGCPIVVKAHPGHPGTSELVAIAILRAVEKAKMPEGVFSLIHGRTAETGQAIARHPLIAAIGFTGSLRAGKALFDTASRRDVPIPVYSEMGSVNPLFILPEALAQRKDQIARDLAASVTQGVGQFCTNPGLVMIEDSPERESFTQSVKGVFADMNSGVMLNHAIQDNYRKGVEKLKNTGQVAVVSTGNEKGTGYQGTPAIFETSAAAFLSDHSLEEEVFGPSSLIVNVNGRQQLLQVAQNLSGHLTATVHGTENDLVEYQELLSILETKVGRVIINGYPTGVEVCHSMVHGGPFPATTDSRTTSVGTRAINRFVRPVCFQNFPQALLPEELRDGNPLGVWRLMNGSWTKD